MALTETPILLLDTQHGGLARQLPALRALDRTQTFLQVSEPEAALELLAQRTIGVVVADFGAATEDCVSFFQDAATRQAASIRVALAPAVGDLAKGFVVGGPHCCLASGCAADQIHAVIQRCRAVWDRVQQRPALARMLSSLEVIPTPPAIYFDIRDALEQDATTLADLVELVQRDAALAAKVLKVANSGFFGAPRSVSELGAALRLIGMELLLALALTSHLLQCLPLPGVQIDKLWLHGVAVSTLARFVARDEGADHATAEVAAVAGLLHDVGGLLLLANFPGDYQRLLRQAAGDELQMLELEQAQFGTTHPELGGLLLALWNLPEAVVGAVERHHAPAAIAKRQHGLAAYAVFMAEMLLQDIHLSGGSDVDSAAVDLSFLDQEKVAGWRELCPELLVACGGGV